MTILQKALLKDLQEDLNEVKNLKQEHEVTHALNQYKLNIDLTIKLIKKES